MRVLKQKQLQRLQIIKLALAFVGLVVGAGFASGQEIVQFFVSYGKSGIYASLLTATLVTITGYGVLQLGSYYLAVEHSQVFDRVLNDKLARLADITLSCILFCLGFVMLAGAGVNMRQQFGWPAWWGSLLITVLVILVGMLNVDKVIAVVGGVTPLIIFAVVIVTIHTLTTAQGDALLFEHTSTQIPSPLPFPWLSAINYVGLVFSVSLSMAIVMGGDQLNPRVAGWGGLVGGLLFSILMLLSITALYMSSSEVKNADMPMLMLVDQLDSRLSLVMSLVILAMIFNTAICMFYSLAKRISGIRSKWYTPALVITTFAGFVCSFLEFKTLVAVVYPFLGWFGLIMTCLLLAAWFKRRQKIEREQKRRKRLRVLVSQMLRPVNFFKRDRREMLEKLSNSVVDDKVLYEQVLEEVAQRLEAKGRDFDADLLQRERDLLKDESPEFEPGKSAIDPDVSESHK